MVVFFNGAENRTRTGTDVTPRDFKSLASAYSATSASLEASPGIEPGMKALQASALPLGYDAVCKRVSDKTCRLYDFGAGDGIRTRDFHLGKVAFYH